MGMQFFLKQISNYLLLEMKNDKKFCEQVFSVEPSRLESYLERKNIDLEKYDSEARKHIEKHLERRKSLYEEELKTRGLLKQNPIYQEGNCEILYLEKNWDVVNHILTGIDKELEWVIFGPNALSSISFGYGPVLYLTSDEVKVILNKLLTITLTDVKNIMQSDVFVKADKYCFNSDFSEDFEYYFDMITDIKNYFKSAATKNFVMLCVLR
jgi:hypothetical protein